MTKSDVVRQQCKTLKLASLGATLDEIIQKAEKEQCTYLELVGWLMDKEIQTRKAKDMETRTKQARLPLNYNLDLYDSSVDNGLQTAQLKQIRELKWLEQGYNLVFMGPSGTGKTYLAAGLCFDAIEQGYKAYFKTMEDVIKVLKMKDITRTAANEYKRIIKAHLLVIDDIMMFPVTKQEAVAFFNLINELHGKTSLIITTNKSPKEWVDFLEDSVIVTAILDRILFRCDIIKLQGKGYRMANRKNFFEFNN